MAEGPGISRPASIFRMSVDSSGHCFARYAGYILLHQHPNTGQNIEGFHVPLWDQACTLVRQAAVRFLPIRTIGWDVALTPTDPVIVEGNVWWDPANQHRNLHIVLQAIRDLCPSLT